LSIYVNRVLNLRKIKAIGFDMDHTLVKYKTNNFEKLTYKTLIERLVTQKKYPKKIRDLKFNIKKMSHGLMLDSLQGTIIKISRFGKVKTAMRGGKILDYNTTQELYSNNIIDPKDKHIMPLNTSFAMAHGILYADVIQLKIDGLKLPSYSQIAADIKDVLDEIHTDGSLKSEVKKNLGRFIIQDDKIVLLLETLKASKKKIFLITNSDYEYTKILLEYAINPFIKNYKDWSELFDVVVTMAQKPEFFTEKGKILEIDKATGFMKNVIRPIQNGVYQGGSGRIFEEDFSLKGEDILYLGDHIYGDVVRLKKKSGWRTGMVIESLKTEIESLNKVKPIQEKIDTWMIKKRSLENELNKLFSDKKKNSQKINILFEKIESLDRSIQNEIKNYQKHFNPYWGELMRAGQEESFYADLVQRYACIYMSSIADLLDYSTRTYFRPYRRLLAHEI